ncbi:glycosyltransferase family 4 protein [Pedobacter montanisoli]|uniref:Glycosyltransferase family 4 protein n=1 Tax=Pedobacter montanisoli TaxID=2923277 RepID=A0ABS9ZVV6_9SPHI|nr:glycosyltransferase family 4 protein [Pedobacter montanisoli]MCJ0742435.1 glycosyltransferase family 4 protein [Pedobacter montanisoli]
MLIIFSTHPIQYQVPLWQAMAKEGIDFEVWYFTDFGLKSSFDIQFGKSFSWDLPMLEGYKYRFLRVNENAAPNKGFRGIVLKDNLKRLLKERKATHVYINGWQVLAYWQVLWTAKSLGLTTIFKGESNDLKPVFFWKQKIKKLLLSQFFNRIDYFLYIGEANKRLYLKHNINPSKLLPGLYCVDNDRFHTSSLYYKAQNQTIRNNWGIAKGIFCILFSGKFIQKKRPLDIIKAVKLAQLTNLVHIVFVGDGELYDEIKQHANVVFDKENGIINTIREKEVNISIIGFLNQTEISKAYAVADCLVLPSDYGETWGLVVNEAMASGLPVIAANECGSAEDLVKPLNPSLVYKTGDIEALAASILNLINNPADQQKIQQHINKYTYLSTINSVKTLLGNAHK